MHFSLHFFIAYLFAKSMHIAVSIPDMRHIVCAVGSFLFMISDISILFLYFYKNKSRKVHLFNLTTYYVGIFLLAISPLFH
ncbi:MAG: lysoplasmalogenase family protein [Roseburia inulinivorans]